MKMRHFSPRALALGAFGIAGLITAPSVHALTNPIPNGTVTVKLESIGSLDVSSGAGIGEPLAMTYANDGTNRLFVATHSGHVRVIKNGALLPTPYDDLEVGPGAIGLVGGFGTDERGLLGLAFHPDFNVSGAPGFGKFYTYTSEAPSTTTTFGHPELAGSGGNNQAVLREWKTDNPLSDTFTFGSGLSASRILLSVKHPQSNHNGGALVFGPDKKLYISMGDGGGGNDFSGNTDKAQTTNDGHTNNTGNGQDITNVYGKILRIDPLHPSLTTSAAGAASTNGEYRVPTNNPFSGVTPGVDEILAYGLRNPFRIGFDRNNPNNLYIGDVGQGQREEVDVVNVSTVTSSNNNYGWPFREGTRVNTDFQDANDVTINPPGGFSPVAPIAEYTHGEGISVIGGYVYRGSLIPELAGKYVFAEYLETGQSVGMLLYMDPAVGDISEMLIAPSPGLPISSRILAIGEDQQGELYAILFNGQMVKLVPEPGSAAVITLGSAMALRRRRLR